MLRLDNISFAVDGDDGHKEILRGVDLEFTEPFTVITGPNGGGKSTLAKLISGIYRPVSGKIWLDDVDITDMSVSERANAGISYAFQQPVRFKGITVADLIKIASGKNIGISEACDYLSEVGLCARDYIDREINASLSGGELKRIEIATVLARGSAVSVFDEPEAGIDLWSFGSLIKVFENMQGRVNGSIIIISHQERILNIADSIVVVADGEVVGTGSRDEILPTLLQGSGICSILEKKL